MHVGFLTPEYPHPKVSYSAGIGTSIKNLAKQLVIQNHQVTVFVYSQDRIETFNDDGITIQKIANKKYKILGWLLHRKYIQNFINNSIAKENIDIIEAPDWTGITAFMKFRCPLVIRLHGTDAYFCSLEGRKQKAKNFFFEKLALVSANSIVSVSAFTAGKTREIFKLDKPIQVIYNGIDISLFRPLEISAEMGTILYFGSIIRKKGLLELAHIFNKVIEKNPNVQLKLLGKDVVDVQSGKSTLSVFLSILSNEAKQRIRHIDNVPYNEVKNYIAKAHIVVLPSFAEAFPMTWLEAMAMEKAMVTSNIGWASELMLEGKTGFMVHPENHDEYANKIIELLDNHDLSKQLGKQARVQIVKSFAHDKIALDNVEYFKSIIA